MEQLRRLHEIMCQYSESRSERNLHAWMYLASLRICSDANYEVQSTNYELESTKEGEEICYTVRADDLSLYLNGYHLSEEERRIAGSKAVLLERRGVMDWLDEPLGKDGHGGLTQLPIDAITIGKKKWRLPSALITSITYEQYTNAQQLEKAIWELTSQLKDSQKQILEDATGNDPNVVADRLAELEPVAKELQRYRAQLLSHLLIPDEKGAEYKSEDAEERVDFFLDNFDEHPFLLDILIQHLQSCLGVYKTQFPELFSGDGSGSDFIPLVGEINTVNAIMKWQGYQEQQKVYDSNAIFIFSILNSMTKEAKALEELKLRKLGT